MLLNLLNFFEDASTDTGSTGGSNIIVWIIFAVMIALMIVMMVVPQRKAKKQQEEMQSKLGVGVVIMTIGGIIGEIVKMEGDYIWISTGLDDNKQVMLPEQSTLSLPHPPSLLLTAQNLKKKLLTKSNSFVMQQILFCR